MLTHLRFKAAQLIVVLTLLGIPVVNVAAATFIGSSGDYGDAPEGRVEAGSYTFPSTVEDDTDSGYVMHFLPQERVFLGRSVTFESNALATDQDLDDGWAATSSQTCTPVQYELQVTLPSDAVVGPVYLNVLFDWNHDGTWAGADAPCPAGTRQPSAALGQPWATPIPVGLKAVEWGVQNLRLDLPPFNVAPGFSGNILLPGVLTGTQPGRVWMRFTVSTEPVDEMAFVPAALNGQGWNGQGSFVYGETEDYQSCLVGTEGQAPAGCPTLLAQVLPADPAPQADKAHKPELPSVSAPANTPASKGNGNDNSSADTDQPNDSAQDSSGDGTDETSNDGSENVSGDTGAQDQTSQDNADSSSETSNDGSENVSGEKDKQACNAGKGNGSEEDESGQDCDPGNSGDHNNAGDGIDDDEDGDSDKNNADKKKDK